MPTRVQIIFYSLYGHVFKLAETIAAGAREVPGAEVEVLQVAETLPETVLQKMGAVDAKKAFAHIPIADPKKLAEADAILIGTGTRYGSATAQMQTFLDATGSHWQSGALVGKAGGVFTSSATQHGGQETTLFSIITNLLHFGMTIVGLNYGFAGQMKLDEVTGGSPYGATTITGGDGSRQPSENELAGARYQGLVIAETAKKLHG